MAEPIPLAQFFVEYGALDQEAFLEKFPGAFLLIRSKGSPPAALELLAQEGFKLTVGSDEDVDLAFEMDQTLDGVHATISYHVGFRGWNIEDHNTSFATHVDDERLTEGRPLLLRDRQKIRPGGGLVELEFYLSQTLWDRMNKAGLTKRIKRGKK